MEVCQTGEGAGSPGQKTGVHGEQPKGQTAEDKGHQYRTNDGRER